MTMKYLVRFYKLDVPNHKSIMAIKLLRDATGCKLLSAKKIISGHRGEPPSLAIMSEDQYQRMRRFNRGDRDTLSRKKLLAAFKIPKSFLGYEEDILMEECGYQMVLLDKKDLP